LNLSSPSLVSVMMVFAKPTSMCSHIFLAHINFNISLQNPARHHKRAYVPFLLVIL
jgi:hypothetical protein